MFLECNYDSQSLRGCLQPEVCVFVCKIGKILLSYRFLVRIRWDKLHRILYQLAQAAKTQYHRQGGLNNRNLSSHGSGDWKSNIKVPVGSLSGLDLTS